MNIRKLELGDKNIVGARVTLARKNLKMKQIELLAKLQLNQIEISIPALSLLEGQKRPVLAHLLIDKCVPIVGLLNV